MACPLRMVIEIPSAHVEDMVGRLRSLGYDAKAATGWGDRSGEVATGPDDALHALDALGEAARSLPIEVVGTDRFASTATSLAMSSVGSDGEAQLRAILHAMTEGVVLIDKAGTMLMVNPAITDILGYSPEDLLGRNVSMLMPRTLGDLHDTFIANYLNTGVGQILGVGLREVDALHKDGSSIPVELAINETRNGDSIHFIGVLRDVTARRAADDALRRSEANLVKAQRIAGLGNWEWNLREGTLTWSLETFRMLHVRPEDHDGTINAFLSRVHPEERANIAELVSDIAAGKVPCDFEHRFIGDDGTENILHILGETERDEHGEVVRVFGTAQDITSDRHKDDLLRESEQRLAEAAHMAQVGYMVWQVDTDRCLYCSDIYAAIHGVTPEIYAARAAMIDAPFSFTHPEDAERYRETIRRLRENGEPTEIEYRIVTPDGETRHVRESLKTKRDAAGKVTHDMCTLQDITSLRAAEQRLVQVQKREAIGNLTGGVAHDFNNILGVILGNLELVELCIGDNTEARQLLRAAIGATERGAGLTRQLLAFSRQQELEPRVVEIDTFIGDLEKLLRRTFSAEIELTMSLGAKDALVRVDPGQLEAAVLNLALNASDAMPHGGTLAIHTSVVDATTGERPLDDDNAYRPHACIRIHDSGHGIPRELVDKVFEPFFTTKEIGKGTGLGLSMVSGFVQQSGGQIDLYSEEGQGTVIRLYLPLCDASARDDSTEEFERPLRPATILVVEDDPQVRDTARGMLTKMGFDVVVAGDGYSAIRELAARDDIELLFTDMIMPGGINGNDLALRAEEMQPGLRVLLTSGYPGDAFLKGRRFPFLAKPYNFRELISAIKKALDGVLYERDAGS